MNDEFENEEFESDFDDIEESDRRRFNIFDVMRIVDRIYKQHAPDIELVQEQMEKRLKVIGIKIDLDETRRRHTNHEFKEDAEIIGVVDDGMQFIRYHDQWIFGADKACYICLRVLPDHMEVLRSDGEVDIKKA
jgi:hypothetical protein